jgi:peptidoglycan/xylan/chitin deacetylase (PgdA/CDA1 family)
MRIRGRGRIDLAANRIRNTLLGGTVILLYHRVAEMPSDPQLLCVSPQHFEEHLQVLTRVAEPLRLQQLAALLAGRKAPRHGIVITFDDGAADNLHNAKPSLERHDVPATVFVASGYTGSGREFWWDELDRLLLQPGTLPERLTLALNGKVFDWQLGSATRYSVATFDRNRSWNVLDTSSPTERHNLYRSLCDLLRPLSDSQRSDVIETLRKWSGQGTNGRDSHRVLTHDEIRQVADGGLVEVGAHTVAHPVLSAITAAEQTDEIHRGKIQLEEILEQPVVSFAYPYGTRDSYSAETVKIVREAGFVCACSNFTGVVQPKTDIFELPRFVVRDWNGDEFERRLVGFFRG